MIYDLKRYVDLKMIVWSGATFILRWSCIIGGNLNGILSFLRGTNGATLLEPKPVAGVSDGFLWAKTESCCCRQRCGGSTTTRLIAQPQISSEDFVMVIRDLSFYRTQVRPCLLLSMLTHWENKLALTVLGTSQPLRADEEWTRQDNNQTKVQ